MLKGDSYCITPDNAKGHELVGLEAKVAYSTDPNKKGIVGRIVDESRNTVTIDTKKGEKRIPKKEVTLKVTLGKEKVEIKGDEIIARPEDRVKLYWRKFRG